MTNNYTSVAKIKIEELKKHKNFVKIITENSRYTIIEFKDSIYKVTSFGKVTRGDKNER